MLPLALILFLLTASIASLLLGLRGRVTSTGQFCGNCRFSLIGLDLTRPAAKCPECGRPVDHPTRRTQSLRTRRPTLIVVSVLALISAGWVQYLNVNPHQLYRHLPDRLITSRVQQGSHLALMEAVDRLSNPTHQSEALRSLIDQTVDRIAATSQASTGESMILDAAIASSRLTADQYARIAASSGGLFIETRRRIHPGARRLPFAIIARSINGIQQSNSLNRDIVVRADFVQQGLPASVPLDDPSFSIVVRDITRPGPMQSSFTGEIPIPQQIDTRSTSDHFEVRFTVEQRFEITANPGAVAIETSSASFTVEVAEPGRPLVVFDTDPTAAVETARNMSIRYLARPVNVTHPTGNELGSITTAPGPHRRAWYRVSFIIDGAEEPVGNAFVQFFPVPKQHSQIGSHIEWTLAPSTLDEINATLQRWSKADRIDVVLRPDPEVEHARYLISSMPDASFVFRDVPVRVQGFDSEYPPIPAEILPPEP